MNVILTDDLQQTIFQQMEATYPNEGGGFLLGTRHDNTAEIVDVIQIDNVFETEEQYHRYAMTPQNWMQIEDEADERGLTLLGYYHSHPNSPAVPSEYDRAHALPNFIYIITEVTDNKAVEMRVWRLQQTREAFDELTLVINET
jgi:proteasome lid subunit RPN8/RPN11